MASGNGPLPAGRNTRTRNVAPVAVAISAISWAAVSTVAAGAARAGHRPSVSSNTAMRIAMRRRRTSAQPWEAFGMPIELEKEVVGAAEMVGATGIEPVTPTVSR